MEDITVTVLITESILMSEEFVDILEKEFKIDTRGYRLKEVDQFLDIIIGDYEALFKIIRDNEKEKEELNEQIVELKQQIRNLKTSIEIAKGASDNDTLGATNTNLDVMKRLAQLEKIVYGKDE